MRLLKAFSYAFLFTGGIFVLSFSIFKLMQLSDLYLGGPGYAVTFIFILFMTFVMYEKPIKQKGKRK